MVVGNYPTMLQFVTDRGSTESHVISTSLPIKNTPHLGETLRKARPQGSYANSRRFYSGLKKKDEFPVHDFAYRHTTAYSRT